MNNNEEFDYSEDFSPEELYGEELEEYKYKSFEDHLRDLGMSIHDFI